MKLQKLPTKSQNSSDGVKEVMWNVLDENNTVQQIWLFNTMSDIDQVTEMASEKLLNLHAFVHPVFSSISVLNMNFTGES